MPTTTPPNTPRPVEPPPQPIRAPPPAPTPPVAARIAPASAGWNDGRGAACISRARIPEVRPQLVTHGTGVTMRFLPKFVRLWKDTCVSRPRVLLVHGSVANAEATWSAQRPLAERFELVAPNRRGFPPGPDVERGDFEDEAVWLEPFLEPGTHLVGHSYGGVISLLAAARRPELLRSLTVIEPPAFGVARGNPVADRLVADAQRGWRSE